MQANLPALTQPADHPASNSVLGNYQDIPPRLLLLYCPIHLLCCWRVRRCPFCTAPAAATCPSSPLALLQGYTITDEGAVLFAAVAAAPPPVGRVIGCWGQCPSPQPPRAGRVMGFWGKCPSPHSPRRGSGPPIGRVMACWGSLLSPQPPRCGSGPLAGRVPSCRPGVVPFSAVAALRLEQDITNCRIQMEKDETQILPILEILESGN